MVLLSAYQSAGLPTRPPSVAEAARQCFFMHWWACLLDCLSIQRISRCARRTDDPVRRCRRAPVRARRARSASSATRIDVAVRRFDSPQHVPAETIAWRFGCWAHILQKRSLTRSLGS
jgi:hypothetical protein